MAQHVALGPLGPCPSKWVARMEALSCCVTIQLLAAYCLVMHSMCLQNETIMEMLQQLDTQLSRTREPELLKSLWADVQFAQRLAKDEHIGRAAARKAQIVEAMFGHMGKFGIIATEL